MEHFNTREAIAAQRKYCEEKGFPHFAPESKCYRCHKDIYEQIEHEKRDWETGQVIGHYTTGISVERAGSELITGCPHCCYSYCD